MSLVKILIIRFSLEMLKLLLIFLLSLSYSGAFRFVKNKRVCTYDIINTINTRFMSVKRQPTIKEINIAMLPMISSMPSIALALDDDTLNALGKNSKIFVN